MRWQAGQITQHKYWQIDFTPQEIEQEAARQRVRHALIDSIEHHRETCTIAKQYLPDEILPMRNDANLLPNLPSLEDEVSWLEINSYMRNQLLMDNDVMSMSCGLELRVPLVDKVLIEAIASIPSQIRLARGKQLLIQAVNELPSEVINRPKQPFAFHERSLDAKGMARYFSSIRSRFKYIFNALVSSLEFGYFATLVGRD